MEIVYFLLAKNIALVYFLFVIGFPIIAFLAVFFEVFSATWARWCFAAICVLPLIAYYHTTVLPPFVKPKSPSRSAYETLFESYDEYEAKKKKVVPTRINQINEVRRYELINWKLPKHFYVTFKDVETGFVYENKYVSQYCDGSLKLKQGEKFNLEVQTYALSNDPNSTFVEFKDLYGAFCK